MRVCLLYAQILSGIARHFVCLQLWYTPLHAAASQGQLDVLMEVALHLADRRKEMMSRQSALRASLSVHPSAIGIIASKASLLSPAAAAGQAGSRAHAFVDARTPVGSLQQAGKPPSKIVRFVQQQLAAAGSQLQATPSQGRHDTATLSKWSAISKYLGMIGKVAPDHTHAQSDLQMQGQIERASSTWLMSKSSNTVPSALHTDADEQSHASIWFAEDVNRSHVWKVLQTSLKSPDDMDMMLLRVTSESKLAMALGVGHLNCTLRAEHQLST